MSKTKIPLHDETIRIQYANGLSIQEIADRHYVSYRTIYRKLKELNIKIQTAFFRKVTEKELTKLYIDKKHSVDSLSKKYKVSKKTMIKALNIYGIKKLNPSKGKGVKDERTSE